MKLQELQYKPLAIAVRKTSEWHTTGVVRNADPARGNPASVSVKCKKCGTLRGDNAPVFVNTTEEYLIRLHRCPTCEPTEAQKAGGYKAARVCSIPVSEEMKSVTGNCLRKALKRAKDKEERERTANLAEPLKSNTRLKQVGAPSPSSMDVTIPSDCVIGRDWRGQVRGSL